MIAGVSLPIGFAPLGGPARHRNQERGRPAPDRDLRFLDFQEHGDLNALPSRCGLPERPPPGHLRERRPVAHGYAGTAAVPRTSTTIDDVLSPWQSAPPWTSRISSTPSRPGPGPHGGGDVKITRFESFPGDRDLFLPDPAGRCEIYRPRTQFRVKAIFGLRSLFSPALATRYIPLARGLPFGTFPEGRSFSTTGVIDQRPIMRSHEIQRNRSAQ